MFTNALGSMLNCIRVQRGGKRRRKITIKHLYRCEPMHRLGYIYYIYSVVILFLPFFLENRFRVNVKRRSTLRDQRERVKNSIPNQKIQNEENRNWFYHHHHHHRHKGNNNKKNDIRCLRSATRNIIEAAPNNNEPKKKKRRSLVK